MSRHFPLFDRVWGRLTRDRKRRAIQGYRCPCRRRLHAEPLEERRLLSVSIGDQVWSDLDATGRTGLSALAAGQSDTSRDVGLADAAPSFGFALSIGATGHDRGQSILHDSAGNFYVCGEFSDTVDFDPSPGVFELTSDGKTDVFVAKYTSAGAMVWARRMGGTDGDGVLDMTIGDDGSVYTTGSFSVTADFDPGPDVYPLTSAGQYDVFVSKLDASGNFVWARSMGGMNEDSGSDIAVAADGSVYITGGFSGTADFDPGPAVYDLSSAGEDDAFLWKLDASGNFAWARCLGGSGLDYGCGITLSADGSVYTIGDFSGTVDFDPGPAVYSLTSPGERDVFLWKLDASGDLAWARRLGANVYAHGTDIVLAADGSVYTIGDFYGTVDFDPGPDTYDLPCEGWRDVFVSKLDASGNFAWARRLGGTGMDYSYGIALSADGSVYAIGGFSETVDFDPGPAVYNLTSAGSHDAFLWKLDASGDFAWARRAGGTKSDYAMGIAVDDERSVYATGFFWGTADFDLGPDTCNLTSAGNNYDAFVWKFDDNRSPEDLSLSFADVDENQPTGTAVGLFTTSDPDPAETFRYTLVPGAGSDDNASFTIDGDQLLTAAAFDYEAKSSYSIRVRTTDGGNLSYEKEFTITVTDVDEIPPVVATLSPSLAGGTLVAGTTTLVIDFNEPVLGGDVAANYTLQSLGPDALLGTVDDTIAPIAATYAGTTATLTFAGLSENIYRLTIRDTITDETGNQLDGDANGMAGGSSVRDFVVLPSGDLGAAGVAVATYSNDTIGILSNGLAVSLFSPHGMFFDVQAGGYMAGQLVQGTGNAFDGLNRLQVDGVDYAPAWAAPNLKDGGRTIVTPDQTLSGLVVSRETTVPDSGNENFARTIDTFTNPTGAPITTTVRIVGNLGSDGATTVFATSDGDADLETTDQWIGTDDADGSGTPAVVHYLHGPEGVQPVSVLRTGDNLEWTCELTVPAGETVRLAYFTILATTRADAEAAAEVLVGAECLGGQAAVFLTPEELQSLANFFVNDPPVALAGGPYFADLGASVTLDGSGSYDSDEAWGDSITSYAWDIADGTYLLTGVAPSLTPAQLDSLRPGTYRVVLTVTDQSGATGAATAQLRVPEFDLADAPDHPTLMLHDGARHVIVPGFQLGASVDGETDGQPDAEATGDDADGSDDEDGVTIQRVLIPAQTCSFTVTGPVGGKLDAWIDWNQNGSWLDEGEQILASEEIATGVQTFELTVPADALPGATFARFRLSSAGGLSPAGLALDGEVEDYRVDVAEPLGPIDFLDRPAVPLASGTHWYTFTATRAATLTVLNQCEGEESGLPLALYGADLHRLADSQSDGAWERIDWSTDVAAGERYYVRVTVPEGGSTASFRLANLLTHSGTTVTVAGTARADHFQFDAAAGYRVTINDVAYQFAAAEVDTISFDGARGDDTAELTGSGSNEMATLYPSSGMFTGEGFSVTLLSTARITVHAGDGNKDSASLYGSGGDDLFVAGPDQGMLSGNGFSLVAVGFDYLHGMGKGGNDTAELRGSANGDEAVLRTTYTQFRGPDFFLRARDFDEVSLDAAGGEGDTLFFFDGKGDDVVSISPAGATFTGSGIAHEAVGFDTVYAAARTGGYDKVTLFDGPKKDKLVTKPLYGYLVGDGYYYRAARFEEFSASGAAGGDNVAWMYDSCWDDTFTSGVAESVLSGPGFKTTAVAFKSVYAVADAGGCDTAHLYDSPGWNKLEVKPRVSVLYGPGYYRHTDGFDYLYAHSQDGEDVAELTDSAGDDLLQASTTSVKMQSRGAMIDYYYEAIGFKSLTAKSTGGKDKKEVAPDVTNLTLTGPWE